MFLFLVYCSVSFCFFFKQKTAYEMRISDWSSDVCSSDLILPTASANSYLFTCSDAAELSIQGVRLGDGTATRLISMSSSTASDKGWSLSLDNCTLDIRGTGRRGTVTCCGYWKILRVTNR